MIVNFSNFKALPVDKDISQQEIVNFITLTMECGEISRSTGQFYWWRKPEYLEKTTELPQLLTNFIT
jgi:hypothetical protein